MDLEKDILNLEKNWNQETYTKLEKILESKIKECVHELNFMDSIMTNMDESLSSGQLDKDVFDTFLKDYENSKDKDKFKVFKEFINKDKGTSELNPWILETKLVNRETPFRRYLDHFHLPYFPLF